MTIWLNIELMHKPLLSRMCAQIRDCNRLTSGTPISITGLAQKGKYLKSNLFCPGVLKFWMWQATSQHLQFQLRLDDHGCIRRNFEYLICAGLSRGPYCRSHFGFTVFILLHCSPSCFQQEIEKISLTLLCQTVEYAFPFWHNIVWGQQFCATAGAK